MGLRATMRIGDYTAKTFSDGDLLIEHDGANEVILGFHEAHALAHFILANLREASTAERRQPEAAYLRQAEPQGPRNLHGQREGNMSEPMSDAELAAIERACAKATPGPWDPDFRGHVDARLARGFTGHLAVCSDIEVDGVAVWSRDNAWFIAKAREWVPALVAELKHALAYIDELAPLVARVRELEAEVKRLREMHESATDTVGDRCPRCTFTLEASCRECGYWQDDDEEDDGEDVDALSG